uniref:Uncharacterized protein n=1 Tax=Arundo donax TaxID=35708 RepID=A0A0A9FH33_ARUDO
MDCLVISLLPSCFPIVLPKKWRKW